MCLISHLLSALTGQSLLKRIQDSPTNGHPNPVYFHGLLKEHFIQSAAVVSRTVVKLRPRSSRATLLRYLIVVHVYH